VSEAGSRWKLDRARLDEALVRWRAHDPDRAEQDLVDAFLMDLVTDPYACGREDRDGVWTGWAGLVLVVYIPDAATRRVFVVDVNYA
jgi:hypothetical protein